MNDAVEDHFNSVYNLTIKGILGGIRAIAAMLTSGEPAHTPLPLEHSWTGTVSCQDIGALCPHPSKQIIDR